MIQVVGFWVQLLATHAVPNLPEVGFACVNVPLYTTTSGRLRRHSLLSTILTATTCTCQLMQRKEIPPVLPTLFGKTLLEMIGVSLGDCPITAESV